MRFPWAPFRRPADAAGGWRALVRRRAFVALVGCAIWAIAIQVRLVDLQVRQHEALAARAEEQQQKVLKSRAPRGDIVDRHGRILAYSVAAAGLGADPSEIDDARETVRQLCAALKDCTATERASWLGRLGDRTRNFAWLRRARSLSPAQIGHVAALDLPGVLVMDEPRRYYPNHDLAAHVLGFVGDDERALGGIEQIYDEDVRGRDGIAVVRTDARRGRLATRLEQPPSPGATVELTIDLALQHIAERELRAGVQQARARAGTAIVLDPYTGEILALANYPTFNPNAFGKAPDDARRNRATQEVYEPGSTFKIVTASAALEEGVIGPMDLVDCAPGFIKFPGRKPIYDTHTYANLSFEDVIVKSSNVGAIRVGLRLGADRLNRYVRRFGFGTPIAADFAGESRGQVYENLDDSGIASVSMGYQISVTPVQVAAAAAAVANGGQLLQPHVVRAVTRHGVREDVEPTVLRRSIQPGTAALLTTMMEGVVERGTGKQAALDRYRVAGKTGTSERLVDGRYSDTEHNASFVGFLPSRRPDLVILVVVETANPSVYFGGDVAAPIFRRIAEAAMVHRRVMPTFDTVPPAIIAATPVWPALPARPAEAQPIALVSGTATLPDVSGLSLRDAVAMLSAAGVQVRPAGSGVVVDQRPLAGTAIADVGVVELRLERGRPDPRGPRR